MNVIDFHGNVEAELWYALSVGPTEALAALESSLANGHWQKAPTPWVRVARSLADQPNAPAALGVLLAKLALVICGGPRLTDEVRGIIVELSSGLLFTGADESLESTLSWLAAKSTPGDAAVVVAVLGGIWQNSDWRERDKKPLPPGVMPLVRWLLESGAAELRTHGHPTDVAVISVGSAARGAQQLRGGDLLFRIAHAVEVHGPKELLPVALRYLLGSAPTGANIGPLAADLWSMVEHGLELGLPESHALDAVRFVQKDQRLREEDRWVPLRDATQYPRSAKALVKALCAGRFGSGETAEGARFLFRNASPSPIAWPVALTLLTQVDLEHRQTRSAPQIGAGATRDPSSHSGGALGPWLAAATSAIAAELTPLDRDSQEARSIARLAGADDLAPYVVEGFRGVFPAGTLCGDLARTGKPGHALAQSLLSAACGTEMPRPPRHGDATPLLASLERLRHTPWFDPVGGIDLERFLAKIHSVEFRLLPDDRAVAIEDGVLLVNPTYPQEAFFGPDPDRALLMGLLYVVHELIHVAQGFAGLDVVRHARAVGAETTILQIDLAADHNACRIIERLVPGTDLRSIKDLNGRGLADFPVGDYHTEASRQRKAVRLASSRFDLAARANWPEAETADGFFSLDFAPGGSSCLAFFSGPPLRLVSPPLQLMGRARDSLVTSADGDRPFDQVLAAVDQTVQELAQEAWRTRL